MPQRLQLTAEQIMMTGVHTLAADAPVADAVHLLADEDIACAVIVDSNGKPKGIVTERDLLAFAESTDDTRAAKLLKRMLLEEHHIFDSMHGLRKASATTVGEIASSPVSCVEADTPLGKIASEMETYNYHQLPVVKDGALVGLVRRQEVVKAIADRE